MDYFFPDDGKSLLVKVVAEYDPPSSFTSEPPSYRAASALTLSCQVEGVDDLAGLFYEWTSTCSGNCFTRGGVSESVSTPYLHSYDTGVHTCMVYDVLGCTGNASITVNVVGEELFFLNMWHGCSKIILTRVALKEESSAMLVVFLLMMVPFNQKMFALQWQK